jgi:hypothetical protein
LRRQGQSTVSDIVLLDGADPQHAPLFRSHALLKREKMRLNRRAGQLGTGEAERDNQAQFATFGKNAELRICVRVNCDSSAGLLTGLAATGRVSYPFREGAHLAPESFVTFATPVEEKAAEFEWAALRRLLDTTANFYESAQNKLFQHGFGEEKPASDIEPRTQIVFWDKRQFESLCAAMGRHLKSVLELAEEKSRALAWLFP